MITRLLNNSYSKQEVCITSYFIKTTVLWLCETENIDAINEQNYDLLTKQLTAQWITFACSKLRNHVCEHYFLVDINILSAYSHETLDQACRILENLSFDVEKSVFQPVVEDKMQYIDNEMIVYENLP
ncbi:unnamed protein product, partial [Didymodactylos carnosus]